MAWLSTHLQASVAAQQCHRLCGVNTVSSPGGTLAWSRNSAATVRVDVPNAGSRCLTVAPNMPRVSLIGTTKGMVCEPEETNYATGALPGSLTSVNIISQVTTDGPDGLPASASRVSIKKYTSVSYVYSAFAFTASASASPSVWARLPVGSTGYEYRLWTAGSPGSAGDWRIKAGQMTQGVWYKIDANTPPGILQKFGAAWNAGSTGFLYMVVDCITGPTDGPCDLDLAFFGAFKCDTAQASSTILTTTAAATRLADSAVYTLSTEIDTKQGMAKVSYDKGPVSGGAITALDISDGGSSSDHVAIGIDASDHATAASAMTGGDAGATAGTTDVRDGAAHTIQATWQDDALTVYADGTAEGTPDTACDMPENLDTITIGPARQLITSIKIWPTNLAKAM